MATSGDALARSNADVDDFQLGRKIVEDGLFDIDRSTPRQKRLELSISD